MQVRKGLKYLSIGLFALSSAMASGDEGERRREEASRLYLEGVKRQNLGTLREAAQCYEAALRQVPEHAASYYRLSGIARMIGEQETALRYGRRAYEIDPACADYADNYARLMAVAGDYAAADGLFTELFRRDSSNLELISILAALKLERGMTNEAIVLLDTLQARSGFQSQTVEMKRQALIRAERYAEAYDYMLRVCEEMPDESAFRIQLAELAAALRRDSVAMENYRRAIEIDSTGVGPRIALAEYYRIKDQWPEFPEALMPVFANPSFPVQAKVNYFDLYVGGRSPDFYQRNFVYMARLADAVLWSAPGDSTARDFYIRHLIRGGQLETAQEYLARWIGEGRVPLSLYRTAIELAHFREQPDTVDRYMAEAQMRFPHDPELGMTRLAVRLQRSDTIGAVEAAHEVIRYSTNDSITSEALSFCGDMAHLGGKHKEAYKYYERALKLTPDRAMLLNNFAYYLSEEGRELERALRMATRANELTPQNATILDTKAWVLYRLGRYEEARDLMRQALVLDTDGSSELFLHYGDILFELGEYFVAKTYWQRALEAGADGRKIEERLRRLEAVENGKK